MGKMSMVIRKRRGVVLFITLSVIAAMLVLVGVIFAYLDRGKEDASHTAALIQADLIFRDSKSAIDALLSKGSANKEIKKKILETLYMAPITLKAQENDEIFTTLDCSPLSSGVNINWLGLENNSSAQLLYSSAQRVFDVIVESHNLQDPARLLSQIKSAIDKKDRFEAQTQGRLERKKGIINLSQLQDIVRDYRFEVDDDVGEIVWEEYFSFGTNSERVDANYISAELIAIFFDMQLEVVKEDWVEGDDLKGFVSSHGGDLSLYSSKLFSEELVEQMKCRVTYGYQGRVYAMGFEYIEQKADRFEFYAEQ